MEDTGPSVRSRPVPVFDVLPLPCLERDASGPSDVVPPSGRDEDVGREGGDGARSKDRTVASGRRR